MGHIQKKIKELSTHYIEYCEPLKWIIFHSGALAHLKKIELFVIDGENDMGKKWRTLSSKI